ncbi:MAG TPA: aminoacyl-tRNA hydrolase [Anaerolineaceae bacterium]|nr:aminoacyl-tRNA hydrolase [Anaerolineaceae bacterium]
MIDAISRLMNRPAVDGGEAPYIIVGLGNPGREYRGNRHNVGFMVVDRIAGEIGVSMTRLQQKALIAQGTFGGRRVILAKPQTFMNLSGQAVASLVKFYKTPLEQLIVIHDDLDLPLGTLRMRKNGSAGGQKGVLSTIERLGTQEFPRLRVGIGRPSGGIDPKDYVLHDFAPYEKATLDEVLDLAQAAVRTFIEKGLETAMNQYNRALDRG